jgi:cytochrome c nitrite reductase small subunit
MLPEVFMPQNDASPGPAPRTSSRLPLKFAGLAILLGILLGLGAFTFRYAEGFSYLSTDPKACVNCHIMQPQFDSWQKSSHHAAATCAGCHLPHSGLAKWIAKADNGYRHSKAFTFQDFHEPIMITESNSRILQANCLACHDDLVHDMVTGSTSDPGATRCVHCHRSVGHGETAGLGGPDRGREE